MPENPKHPWPLDDNTSLINLISEITGEDQLQVAQKLLREEKCLGWNVREDLRSRHLTPHEWSPGLQNFYAQTSAFLYETSVWNRRPLKQNMRAWICNQLTASFSRPLNILSYGDGLGFDSLRWSNAKHSVTYFEVSADCYAYAEQVFLNNNAQQIQMIQSENELEPESFDVVMCLDVLEHVPDPTRLLLDINHWLKQDGLLILHAPFFLIHPLYSTHLKSNQKYSGSCELFTKLGLQPVKSRLFWDPIIFKKTQQMSARRNIPLTTRLGGSLLAQGRGRLSIIHSLLARYMSRGESHWKRDLTHRIQRHHG